MAPALLLLSLGALAAAAAASRPQPADGLTPPTWGNAPQWTATVHVDDSADSKEHPRWTFEYSYDASGADKYEHAAGNGDEVCTRAGGTEGDACSVLNIASNTTTYVWWPQASQGDDNNCCILDVSTLTGASAWIRPDWMQRAGAEFEGVQPMGPKYAQVWTIKGMYDNHYACAVDSKEPVKFWETKKAKLKEWDFTDYKAGPLAPGTLDVPPACWAAAKCQPSRAEA